VTSKFLFKDDEGWVSLEPVKPKFRWNVDVSGYKFNLDIQEVMRDTIQKMMEIEHNVELEIVAEFMRGKGYTVTKND